MRSKMKRSLSIMLIFMICLLISSYKVLGYRMPIANCKPHTEDGPRGVEPFSPGCGFPGATNASELVTVNKTEERVIRWPDNFSMTVRANSTGECRLIYKNCHWNVDLGFCSPAKWIDSRSYCYRVYYECWPDFFEPEYFRRTLPTTSLQ